MVRRSSDDDWQIPDLVAPPPREPRSRSARVGAKTVPTTPTNSSNFEAFGELELEPVGGSFEGQSPRIQVASDCLDDELGRGNSIELPVCDIRTDSRASSASSAREPWPHLRPIEPDHFSPIPEAIEAVRPWGAPPRHWLETPAYAFWVFRGQRALERLEGEERATLRACQSARQALVLEWFEQHRATLGADPRYASELTQLGGVHGEVEAKTRLYGQLAEDAEKRRQTAEATLADLRQRILAKRASEQELMTERDVASRDLSREKAKRQRLDIELRSGLLDEAAHAAQAAKLDAAIAAQLQRSSELAVELAKLTKAREADELALRSEEDGLGRERRREQDQRREAESGLAVASRAAEAATMELLAKLLVLRDPELFPLAVRAEWLLRETDLERAAERLATLIAAKGDFDHARVRQGIWLLLLALALLVAPPLLGVLL